MNRTEPLGSRRSRCRRCSAISSLTVFATLLAAKNAAAAPIFFTIEFTQTIAPPSAGGPPTGQFSIDSALLDTGVTQSIPLSTIADFQVVDDGALFSVIPEPATLTSMAIGVLVLLGRRRCLLNRSHAGRATLDA